MSGDIKSAKDNLKDYEKILDEYMAQIGVSHIQYNNDANEAMMLTREELRGMSPEDCGETAFILQQYAAFLQLEYNRQDVRVKWATIKINEIIAHQGDQYGDKYTKWELRRAMVLAGDTAAQMLGQILIHAEGRAAQLKDVSSKINTMGKHIGDLQMTKRYKK